jgi:hypothetical protein
MKKLLITVSVALILIINVTSCKKIIEQVFPGLDVKVPEIQLTIPAIPFVPPNEISLGSYTAYFNLDSTIKANTGNVFGVGVVSSIKVKEVFVSLANADDLNNLSNFESARVTLSSNSRRDPTNVTTLNFPTSNTSSATFPQSDSPELLDYLKGTEITYNVYGKARRATLKPLNMTVSVTVRVK